MNKIFKLLLEWILFFFICLDSTKATKFYKNTSIVIVIDFYK